MKKFTVFLTALLVFTMMSSIFAQNPMNSPVNKIIRTRCTPSPTPLTLITGYTANFNSDSSGVYHTLTYNSFNGEGITSMEVISLNFNIFKEYTGFTRYIQNIYDPPTQSFLDATQDKSFYYSFAFVNKIRFTNPGFLEGDGPTCPCCEDYKIDVWRVDLTEILDSVAVTLNRIKKIENSEQYIKPNILDLSQIISDLEK